MKTKSKKIALKDRSLPSQKAKNVKGGVRKAGGDQQEYLTIKLEDCLVSGYQTGA